MKNLRFGDLRGKQLAIDWEESKRDEVISPSPRIVQPTLAPPVEKRQRPPVSELVLRMIADGTLDFLDVVRLPEKRKGKRR